MTGSKVLALSLLVLVALPIASARSQFEAERDAEVDALHVGTALKAEWASAHEVQREDNVASVQAAFLAEFLPQDSRLADVIAFFLLGVSDLDAAVRAHVADAPDAQTQVQDIAEEGVRTEGVALASEDQVSVTAQAQAGSVSHSASAQASTSEHLPDQVEAVLQPRRSQQAPAEPVTAENAEPASDAGPDSAATMGGGPMSISSDDQVITQPISLPMALATTAAVLGASTTTAIVAIPGWRTAISRAFRRFGWLVLFSRIAQEDILNHERRSELLEFIRNNPGERVEVARRSLGFSNGSMHYHLRVLQDRGLVKVLKEGSLARLYPRGPKINPAPYVPQQRKRFLEVLGQTPGKTQRELAKCLGLSERMVSYHVHALAEQGLIEVRAEGARKRLFPAQACATQPILAPAA